MISKWKTEALEGVVEIFSGQQAKRDKDSETEKDKLYRKIRKLKIDNDFFKKNLKMNKHYQLQNSVSCRIFLDQHITINRK